MSMRKTTMALGIVLAAVFVSPLLLVAMLAAHVLRPTYVPHPPGSDDPGVDVDG